MYEAETNQLVTIFGDAAKGIPFWVKDLDRVDMEDLLKAAATIKSVKEKALRRQQQKSGR